MKFSSGALSDNPYQGANWVSFCPSKLSNLIYLRSFRDHISLYKIDNQFLWFNYNFWQFYKFICNLEKTSLTKFQFIFLFCKFMSEIVAHIFGVKFPAPILLKIFMKKIINLISDGPVLTKLETEITLHFSSKVLQLDRSLSLIESFSVIFSL